MGGGSSVGSLSTKRAEGLEVGRVHFARGQAFDAEGSPCLPRRPGTSVAPPPRTSTVGPAWVLPLSGQPSLRPVPRPRGPAPSAPTPPVWAPILWGDFCNFTPLELRPSRRAEGVCEGRDCSASCNRRRREFLRRGPRSVWSRPTTLTTRTGPWELAR